MRKVMLLVLSLLSGVVQIFSLKYVWNALLVPAIHLPALTALAAAGIIVCQSIVVMPEMNLLTSVHTSTIKDGTANSDNAIRSIVLILCCGVLCLIVAIVR